MGSTNIVLDDKLMADTLKATGIKTKREVGRQPRRDQARQVILVDSSVWIDFFRGVPGAQAEWLDRNLGVEELVVGDLILAEVLRGFKEQRGFNEARRLLGGLTQVNLAGQEVAIEAARNLRKLRQRGVTVRGTIDVIIATRCLAGGYRLLHNDRDFDAYEQHLGLRVVKCGA